MEIKGLIKASSLLLTSLFVLAGCQDDDADGGNGGTVELTYNIWDTEQAPGMRAMAEAFEDDNPDISVNVEVIPWDQYWTSLESAAQGSSMPDVFWMHSNEIAKYAEGEVLYDLTEMFEESDLISEENYPEELVELYQGLNGNQYGIPKDYDTIGLWYNKELFDAAGLDYPDETWDWEDVLEAAIELTDLENGVYGFLAANNRQEGYHNLIYQNGGYVLSEDKKTSGFREQETIEAVQWWIDLSIEHGVSPTQTQFAENERLAFFQAGRGAMVPLGAWMANAMANNEYTAEHADVAVMPHGESRASIFNGLANSISAFTNHPEEALRFVEFLGSEEAMIIQGESGSAIPVYEGTDDTFEEAFPQFNIAAFTDQLEYGEIKPYSQHTVRWEHIENTLLMDAFLGEVTVEEISEQLASQIEQILESEQSN